MGVRSPIREVVRGPSRGAIRDAGLTPPAGFVFLVDADGVYLTDADGYYLLEAI